MLGGVISVGLMTGPILGGFLMASAMIGTSRQVGIVIGTAVAGTLFTSRKLFHAGQLKNDAFSPEMMSRLSMVGGFRDTLLIATILCAVGLVLSIIAGKRKHKSP
jgi:hypothetical protein